LPVELYPALAIGNEPLCIFNGGKFDESKSPAFTSLLVANQAYFFDNPKDLHKIHNLKAINL
jgi:hypothetical protein